MAEKTAFITGITGQDGSYLADHLLGQGYVVHGLVHRPESVGSGNIKHLVADDKVLNTRLFLHTSSFEDAADLRRVIRKAKPGEVYHLASQSSPRLSLELPETTFDSTGRATLRLLEILRGLGDPCKFLHASSSEVFGNPATTPQNETTPIHPTTPYGAAKAFSQQMTKIYRTAHGMPVCSVILYNHESPRRDENFVTMKVARAVARIKKGQQKTLQLGSLDARRDWGWAPDYVRGMAMMLQTDKIEDFVLATGELHRVEQLVDQAFQCAGLNWRDHVKHDEQLANPIEPTAPCGDSGKARRLLGWQPTVSFEQMVERLVSAELDKL